MRAGNRISKRHDQEGGEELRALLKSGDNGLTQRLLKGLKGNHISRKLETENQLGTDIKFPAISKNERAILNMGSKDNSIPKIHCARKLGLTSFTPS